jgi:hypothetical protein
MKLTAERPYANPEAAARKLVKLAAGIQPSMARPDLYRADQPPFMPKLGGTGPDR